MSIVKKTWFWPAFVIGLLAAILAVNIVMLVVAGSDPSFGVEKNYYQKALDWDKKRAQDVANEALGWSIRQEWTSVPEGVAVTVLVADRESRPIEGAKVSVEAFHVARSAVWRNETLRDEGAGRYVLTWPSMRPGLWEMRYRVEQGDQVFTQTLRDTWTR